MQFQAARRSAAYGGAMSRGSCRRQQATGVAVRQRRRDRSSGRKDEPAVGPARVSIGIAMANRRSSRCDCRRCIETWEAALSPRQTASRCGVPASPSGGIFRCRPGGTAAAAHGCRPARKRPLVERSPEAASLPPRFNPRFAISPRPSGRQISIRSVLRQRASSPVVINRNTHRIRVPPVDYRPADRTSRVVIPPFSYVDGPKFGNVFVRWQHIPVLVPLQFSHKRAPMRETLIGVDEGSGQLRPYVRPVVRRSPRPSWVCAGVSGTDLDSVLKAQENGRYCPSCS